MRIAVIGTGISGNLAARLLHTQHDVHVYEAMSHVGGHAWSVEVEAYGQRTMADVAFMVFNRRTYPNFCRLLDLLEIDSQGSDMSLSVRCFRTGLEYQGSSLNGLFSQRGNLLSPKFYRMLSDILRFNRCAVRFCKSDDDATSLGEFLGEHRLGTEFRDNYLIPMSAAIWSSAADNLLGCPAKFVLEFLNNHGLLQLKDRPRWLTISNRSKTYVDALMRPFTRHVHLNCPVRTVRRVDGVVELTFASGQPQRYDHVVMAAHADQSLRMLVDANATEAQILGSFAYQSNHAILHTDTSVMPRRRRAWASWNYHIPFESTPQVSVTYDLNRLQSLGLPGPLCLTLNPNCAIDKRRELGRFRFQHPVFSTASLRAQRRFDEINGHRGLSFCGAYWAYGFHEDGVNSALAVTRRFGLDLDSLGAATSQFQDTPRELPSLTLG